MKIEDRKPRETRFGTESNEARLARLREQAPTLVGGRRLRLYAIFGSVLLFLTVVAFYMAMQIYKAVSGQREEDALIEVDPAPAIVESETGKALQRAEAEEAERLAELERQLEELKQMDLLGDGEGQASP